MLSKYGIFCEVVEQSSFTGAAEKLNCSQSSVSQSVKNLETELGATLLDRRRGSVTLTADGKSIYPYILSIYSSEKALERKCSEMRGLSGSLIRIGTFTSISRTALPILMQQFKAAYPGVSFELKQGEYTSIAEWLKEGTVDIGFLSTNTIQNLEVDELYRDELMAVLPKDHALARNREVSLFDMAGEPFILIDEGEHNLILDSFARFRLEPRLEYTVTDDYSILAMVRQHLGVSMLYRTVLEGFDSQVATVPLAEGITRSICVACEKKETLPYAAKHFYDYIVKQFESRQNY